jgi:hypothetical protein
MKPILGLGDGIKAITKATGINKLVHFIAGEDCGCEERRIKLNKMFPMKQPLCLLEHEYQYLTEFFKKSITEIESKDADILAGIYTRVFQFRKIYKPCTCDPAAWRELVTNLKDIYFLYPKIKIAFLKKE